MDPEEIAKILQARIDEEEAATGVRSPLRDKPIGSLPPVGSAIEEVPGFSRQGTEDAPYYVPTEETKRTLVPQYEEQQAPAPEEILRQLAPQEPDPEAELRALIPSAFEAAAARTRRSVQPPQGREEGTATRVIENALPATYGAFDELARNATEQSRLAASGQDYAPKPVVDAAQMALPGKGAMLVAGGLLAGELNARKGTPLSATPEELAKLLIPSAGAEPLSKEALIESSRKRLAPEVTVGEPTIQNASVNAPKMPRAPKRRSKESDEAFGARQAEYENVRKEYYKTYTPTAQRIINSVGGPKVIKDADYAGVGTLAAISAGMILAPRVFRAFKSTVGVPPRSLRDALTLQPGVFGEQRRMVGRAVEDAMPGTRAFSSPVDLARSADDINRVVLGIGAKNGIIPAVQERLENTFGIYTRSSARHLTESAVETGRMETPAFRFRAPVSLADMQRTFTPEMREYIVALDTLESLVERSRLPQFTRGPSNPTPGLPTIGGQNFHQVSRIVRAMELAHPEVLDAARAWEAWNKATRRFMSQGEYATLRVNNPNANPALPDRSAAYLNRQHRWEVPWLSRTQDRGMTIPDRIRRQDPIQMQSRYSKIDLRERLENEAIGQYVDAMRQARPGSFVRVGQNARETAELLAENPRYNKNTVTFYRRGVKETYTTDPLLADALKMDPYVMTSGTGQLIYGAKRMIEFGATGLGAPFFAPTSLIRNWAIGKFTADAGYRSPTIMGSLVAIPQQLYPQLAQGIARSLEAGGGGMLSRFAGQGWADSLAQTLAHHYNTSLYAQLKYVGSSRGSILEHERIATGLDHFAQAISQYTGPARPFLNAYKNLLESLHNGPAFNYVRRNLAVAPLPQVAARARALTGDPRVTGQYYFKTPGGTNQAIRYERGGSVSHTAADILVRPYLQVNEFLGRNAIPWFNATQQGIKRIGEAYLNDPVKFVRNMWLYAALPAAAQYLYAHALGKDPNGVSYVDYMMNRRSSYNRQMNWYIPIPGKRAEDGREVPYFHELAPVKRLMEVAMDHMLGNAENTLAQDYWKAAHNFVDTAIIPPMPPILGAALPFMGLQPPMGLPLGPFGGEAYPIKTDPFDQLGGMPANIESFVRTLGGGIGATIGAGYAAFTQTPEGFFKALGNSGSEMSKSMVSRAPLIRDIAGILPPMTGNTDIRKELFEKQKEIDQLLRYYTKWDKNAGQINVKAASQGGATVADTLLGGTISTQPPGLSQPAPTNPLYIKFMGDVYNRFKRESPNFVKGEDQGGIGFRSLWRRYGDATEALKTLRPINDGNNVTWQTQLSTRPDVRKELEEANVNTSNLREVKNYYTRKQQDAARIILHTIRAVEEDLSKQAGRPITLKDLNPYGKPLEEAPFAYPDVVEDVSRNWNQGSTVAP